MMMIMMVIKIANLLYVGHYSKHFLYISFLMSKIDKSLDTIIIPHFVDEGLRRDLNNLSRPLSSVITRRARIPTQAL